MARVVEYSGVTHNSVDVWITGLDGNYSSDGRKIYWYALDTENDVIYSGDSSGIWMQSLGAATTTSTLFTLCDLEPDTTYEVYAKITNIVGLPYDVYTDESAYITTDTEPFVYDLTPVNPVVLSTSENSVDIAWGLAPDANYYKIRYEESRTTYVINTYGEHESGGYVDYTINNLTYGRRYAIDMAGVAPDGSISQYVPCLYGTDGHFYIPPPEPTVSASVSGDSITVSVSSVPFCDNFGEFTVSLYSNNRIINANLVATNEINPGTSTIQNYTGSTTFSNLADGIYAVRVASCLYVDGSYTIYRTFSELKNITVQTHQSAPSAWDWLSSNGNASSGQTQDAGYAVGYAGFGGGLCSEFHHLVWNDLVNKVHEFMVYTGANTWTIQTAMYDFPAGTTFETMLQNATMTQYDRTLTARKFNIVRYCIGNMNSTELDDREIGEYVYGWQILRLTERLNGIQ